MKYLIIALLLSSCSSDYDFTIERDGIVINGKMKTDKVHAGVAKAYVEIEVDEALK